jgi:hypothetical protein
MSGSQLASSSASSACGLVDPFDDLRRHREGGPVGSVKSAPSSKTIKIIAPLGVACWPKCDGSGSPGGRLIAMWFVDLYIGSKFLLAVGHVVKLVPADDCPTRAVCFGHSVGRGGTFSQKMLKYTISMVIHAGTFLYTATCCGCNGFAPWRSGCNARFRGRACHVQPCSS